MFVTVSLLLAAACLASDLPGLGLGAQDPRRMAWCTTGRTSLDTTFVG